MKNEVELKIGPTGTIEAIYQDGIEQFAEEMGAEMATVCRASEVEWEVVEYPDHTEKGWSVRSAKNKLKALRVEYGTQCRIVCSDDANLNIALFTSREAAIEREIQHFWELKNG